MRARKKNRQKPTNYCSSSWILLSIVQMAKWCQNRKIVRCHFWKEHVHEWIKLNWIMCSIDCITHITHYWKWNSKSITTTKERKKNGFIRFVHLIRNIKLQNVQFFFFSFSRTSPHFNRTRHHIDVPLFVKVWRLCELSECMW